MNAVRFNNARCTYLLYICSSKQSWMNQLNCPTNNYLYSFCIVSVLCFPRGETESTLPQYIVFKGIFAYLTH